MAWFNKLDYLQVKSLLAKGLTTKQIGEIIKRPRASVARFANAHGLRGPGFKVKRDCGPKPLNDHTPRAYYEFEDPPLPEVLPDFIRPSMVSLAQFDPVVARALRQRIRDGA